MDCITKGVIIGIGICIAAIIAGALMLSGRNKDLDEPDECQYPYCRCGGDCEYKKKLKK